MNSYNGFSPEQRDKAQRWLRSEWSFGRLARPSVCCVCGQDKGIIDAHAEDYSEPFAAGKTDQFHLCYVCHMMVHCRFKNRDNWRAYRSEVRLSGRARPFHARNFGQFAAMFLNGRFTPLQQPPIAQLNNAGVEILDRIDSWLKRAQVADGANALHLTKAC
jgi:hypothetical protein